MTDSFEMLSAIRRAEYALRRIAEGDHRALDFASDVASECAAVLENAGWRKADYEEET